MNIKKTVTLVFTLALSISFFAGCSGDDSKAGVTKIRVAAGSGYKPFFYIDESGKLQRYDIEVLRAIDELLPQYEFTYETYDSKSIYLTLDSNKADIIAQQIEKNPDRESSYLFGEESYSTDIRYITVKKNNDSIKTLDDLAASGKKVLGLDGDNGTWLITTYNEEHPDKPINLDVVAGITHEEMYTGLTNNKWIGMISSKYSTGKLNTNFSDNLKNVGDPVISSSAYYIYKKGNTELQQAIDGVLRQLKDNGKLTEISLEILGTDLTRK